MSKEFTIKKMSSPIVQSTQAKKKYVRSVMNEILKGHASTIIEIISTLYEVSEYFRKTKSKKNKDVEFCSITIPDGKGGLKNVDLKSASEIRRLHTMAKDTVRSIATVQADQINSAMKSMRKTGQRVNTSLFSDQYIRFLNACSQKINRRMMPVSDFMNNVLRSLGLLKTGETVNMVDARITMNILAQFAKTDGVELTIRIGDREKSIKDETTGIRSKQMIPTTTTKYRTIDKTFEILGDDTFLVVNGEEINERDSSRASMEDKERISEYKKVSRDHSYREMLEGKISYVDVSSQGRSKPQEATSRPTKTNNTPVYETKIHKTLDGMYTVPAGFFNDVERRVREGLHDPAIRSRFYEAVTEYLVQLKSGVSSPRRTNSPTRDSPVRARR